MLLSSYTNCNFAAGRCLIDFDKWSAFMGSHGNAHLTPESTFWISYRQFPWTHIQGETFFICLNEVLRKWHLAFAVSFLNKDKKSSQVSIKIYL